MAVTTTNFDASATDTLIGTLNQDRPSESKVRIEAYGDFGGGTLTFSYSSNEGTSKIPLNVSVNGSAISMTAAEGFAWDAPIENDEGAILLYATLSGATSPDLNVKVSNPQDA